MVCEGIKSKERVAQFGEVYTPANIVNDMLDLVKDESYKLDSTFLEPACGNGNFLVEILRRKLVTASENMQNYDRNILQAICSIYAIDILHDNITEAKQRMISILKSEYINKTGLSMPFWLTNAIKYVLDTNIIHGDGLTGINQESNTDIIIAEWKFSGDEVERHDYTFNQLSMPLMQDTPLKKYSPIQYKNIVSIMETKGNETNTVIENKGGINVEALWGEFSF